MFTPPLCIGLFFLYSGPSCRRGRNHRAGRVPECQPLCRNGPAQRLSRLLPDREALDPSADILRYHYEYCCGVLGDPQFAISMQVEFRDDAAYQAESGRIMRFTGEPADEVTVIWLKGSLEGACCPYLDGEPQDWDALCSCMCAARPGAENGLLLCGAAI